LFGSTRRPTMIANLWRLEDRLGAIVGCLEHLLPRVDQLTPRSQRAVTIVGVAFVHFVLLVMFASTFPPQREAYETTIVLVGGPLPAKSEALRPPEMLVPNAVDVQPPDIALENQAITVQPVVQPAGSPDVTMPAEAIAEAHSFPPLPAKVPIQGMSVRLLLSITPLGEIGDASVSQSSGISALDRIAVDWVKAHWRYRPALRNGEPISVTTMAIVGFVATD